MMEKEPVVADREERQEDRHMAQLEKILENQMEYARVQGGVLQAVESIRDRLAVLNGTTAKTVEKVAQQEREWRQEVAEIYRAIAVANTKADEDRRRQEEVKKTDEKWLNRLQPYVLAFIGWVAAAILALKFLGVSK